MARYIEANKTADIISEKLNIPLGDLVDVFAEIPTADVVEVKRGEWIYHECVSSYDGAKSGYSCSVCSAFVNDEVFESDGFHKDFCGHCGADMRGDGK